MEAYSTGEAATLQSGTACEDGDAEAEGMTMLNSPTWPILGLCLDRPESLQHRQSKRRTDSGACRLIPVVARQNSTLRPLMLSTPNSSSVAILHLVPSQESCLPRLSLIHI